MSPEELSRPKGPKVEPLDRRGSLAAYKAQRTHSMTLYKAHVTETPAERLHRIKDDIAPDVTETREIIAHYLPFIELVEIEQMLAAQLGSNGMAARIAGGLNEVLREAAEQQILNSESIRLGDKVRVLRNSLFHDNIALRPEQSSQINQFWKVVWSQAADPHDLAMEMKALSDLGVRDIERAKPALTKISPIAYLIEVEQALRKIRDHLTKKHPIDRLNHTANRRHPDNGDALTAIKDSSGNISHALEKLGFIKDLKLVVGLRNKILHLQADLASHKEDAAKIERIWGVCQSLGRTIRVHRCLLSIEVRLRGLLRNKASTPNDFEYWSLRRLAKRVTEESSIRQKLESVGVTQAKLKNIESFWKKAENETLSAPTKDDLQLFQEISWQIKLADKSVTRLESLSTLTKSKKQAVLENEARLTKKKPRKDYRD